MRPYAVRQLRCLIVIDSGGTWTAPRDEIFLDGVAVDFENLSIGLAATAALFMGCYALAASSARWGWMPLPSSQHRLGCIDGLRGYLALGVMVHHFVISLGVLAGRPWQAPSSGFFNTIGQAGVVLFFMITGALFYDKLTSGRGPVNWASLYVSRVFRLAPLLWFVTALVAVIVVVRRGGEVGSINDLAAALLRWLLFAGTPDIGGYSGTALIVAGVTWTLAYEWAFYFALPLIALYAAAVRGLGLPPVAAVISLLVAGWACDGVAWRGWAIGFAVPFAIGMLAVELSRAPRIAHYLRSTPAALGGLGALLAALTLFHSAFGNIPYLLLGLFFAPIVAGNSYGSVLMRGGSRVLGEASYGIYLLHGVCLNVFTVDIVRRGGWELSTILWAALPPLGLLVVSLACLTFLIIERPAIRAGRRVAESLFALRGRGEALERRRLGAARLRLSCLMQVALPLMWNLRQEAISKSLFLWRTLFRNFIAFAHNIIIVPFVFIIFGYVPGWAWLAAIPGLVLLTVPDS